MSRRPVVVDGSNLATEGRSMPSLAQLDEAVRAWLDENPDDEVIVVVDASFSYRIDESERKTFEEAEDAGEVVSPPAGAVGRGDGFLLRIADRVDAAVLSNDSFQEFHGEYKWLFDSGRLLGGKPVPGVGWIFTPRTPVRGPKSRMAVRDAHRATKSPRSAPVVKAIAQATAEAIEVPQQTAAPRKRRGARSGESAPVTSHDAVNEPLPFVTFIAGHPLGTEVEGTVASFTSHGAFVDADGARCYVPVVGLGDPPPRTAKAVLKAGEVRIFVVQALDPPRRGIELALPGLARVAGAPTDETVEAEIGAGDARRATPQRSAAGIPPPPRGRRTPAATSEAAPPQPAPPRRSRRSGTPAFGAPVTPIDDAGNGAPAGGRRKTAEAPAAQEETSTDAAATTAVRRARRATKKAAPVATEELLDEVTGKAPARARRSAKRAAPATEAGTTEAGTTEAAETPTAIPPRKRRAAKRVTEPEPPSAGTEEQPTAPRRRAPAKKAAARPSSVEKAPARRATKSAAKKAPATKSAAKKAPATKSAAKKAPATKSTAKKVPAIPPAPEPDASDAPTKRPRRRST